MSRSTMPTGGETGRGDGVGDAEAPPLQVDVVMVHFRAEETLFPTVEAMFDQQTGQLADPIATLRVVDNDVDHPAKSVAEILDREPRAQYLPQQSNIGFGRACNMAIEHGSAPHILLLNPDCRIEPTAIAELSRRLSADPHRLAIGPKIRRPDGSPEISWAPHPTFLWEVKRRRLWRALSAGQDWAMDKARRLTSSARDVDWLTAACLMMRRDAFERIAGFDPAYFLYFEDADLGKRLGEHGKLRFDPSVEVEHLGGSSSEHDRMAALQHYRESQRTYYRKHRPVMERAGLALWRRIRQ